MAYTEVVTTLGNIATAFATAANASNTTTFSITPAGGAATTFTFANGVGIRALASKTGFVRLYDPQLGNPTATALTANLPQLAGPASIVAHGQYDDAAPWYAQGGVLNTTTGVYGPPDVKSGGGAYTNGPQWGMIEIKPTVPAADTVNAASVQTFKGDANTLVVLATG